MGTKFSKAVARRPHVDKAAASTPTTSHRDTQQTGPRQDARLPNGGQHSSDVPVDIAPSPNHDTQPTPATSADAMESQPAQPDGSDTEFLNMLPNPEAITHPDPEGWVPPPLPLPPPPPPVFETVVDPVVTCLICCTKLPEDGEPRAVKPCRCDSSYCVNCLRGMFIDACKDLTRMPPRCCTQIPLHHARPHLTKEEAAVFRSKYEEWSTPNPFYCPVPTCSVFIPQRLLPPTRANGKDRQRVDSGIGTPTSHSIACPKCETEVCTSCRDLAHTETPCNPLGFGLDTETAELLKRWGYKRCPKCGNGVKRMYGCNHMECRCGAHFCWVCLKSRDNCDGNCYDDDEEYDSDEEPDREDDETEQETQTTEAEAEVQATEPNATETAGTTEEGVVHELLTQIAEAISTGEAATQPPVTTTGSQPADTDDAGAPATAEEVALAEAATQISEGQDTPTTTQPSERPAEESTTPPTTPPQPVPRVRNLDGGSGRYWEDQDLDFGREPTDDIQDRAWHCTHSFTTAKVPLADSLRALPSATGMECMKCWATIHPEVEMPDTVQTGNARVVGGEAGRGRTPIGVRRRRAMLRGRERPRVRERATQNLPAVGGFPSSLPEFSFSPASQPMEDVEYTSPTASQLLTNPEPERVVDTYGNLITTTETPRRPSLASLTSLNPSFTAERSALQWIPQFDGSGTSEHDHAHPAKKQRISLDMDTSPFSFAYECDACGLLVCNACREGLVGDQKREDDEEVRDEAGGERGEAEAQT